MKNQLSSRLAYVYAVFAAFFTLSCSFINDKATFIVESQINLAWCFLVLGIAVFLIVHFRKTISRMKLTALAILYLLIPFSFYFRANELQFVILRSSLFLAAALVTTSVMLFIFILRSERNIANYK
jgi:hypothetical protein